jgi:hypothetical protein
MFMCKRFQAAIFHMQIPGNGSGFSHIPASGAMPTTKVYALAPRVD